MNGQAETGQANGQVGIKWDTAEKVAIDDVFKGTGYARSYRDTFGGSAVMEAEKGRTRMVMEKTPMANGKACLTIHVRVGTKHTFQYIGFSEPVRYVFHRRGSERTSAEASEVRLVRFDEDNEVMISVNGVNFYMK